MNFLSQRMQSFKHAFRGILTFFRTQPNARLHLVAAILVIVLGLYVSLSPTEWMVLTGVIFLVFVTEALNTSIEFLADAFTKEHNESIKRAKDVGAGAVLLASICAIITGLLIFLPKFL